MTSILKLQSTFTFNQMSSLQRAEKGDRILVKIFLTLLSFTTYVFILKTPKGAGITVQGFLIPSAKGFSKMLVDHTKTKQYYSSKSEFQIFNDLRRNNLILHVSTTGYPSTNSLKNSTDGNALYATVASTSNSITERSTSDSVPSPKDDQTQDILYDKIGSVEHDLKKQLYDEVNASFDINAMPTKRGANKINERKDSILSGSQFKEDASFSTEAKTSTSERPEHRTEPKLQPSRPPSLPPLSFEQELALSNREKIHMQFRKGRTGNGVAVVDIEASEEEIWSVLRDFRNYPRIIPTIRDVKVNFEYKDIITKGIFIISKFRFRLGIVHRFTDQLNRLDFSLDDDRSNYGSILELAQGFWYVEQSPNFYLDPKDNIRKPKSRIYLCADVKVNRFVPMWLVEYASERALSRATSWIIPHFEKRTGLSSRDDNDDLNGGNTVPENEVNGQRLLELKRFQ